MGYGSLYIVQNFGMLCFTIFLPFITRILAPALVWICKKSVCKVNYSSLVSQSKDWLQYGFWVSFFDETYLFLMVCSGLNLRYNFEWSKGGDAVITLISMFFGFLLVVFPFFVAVFYNLRQNYERIEKRDSNFAARFGSIVDGLNIKRRGRWALLYPCANLFRKMWLAYVLVF